MNDTILNESIIEESEPITSDELLAHLLQDLVAANSPDGLADEFIEDFVLQDRDETAQILSLLEMPTDNLVGILKATVGQSYRQSIEAIDTNGVSFLENLKVAVRERMTQLASDTA